MSILLFLMSTVYLTMMMVSKLTKVPVKLWLGNTFERIFYFFYFYKFIWKWHISYFVWNCTCWAWCPCWSGPSWPWQPQWPQCRCATRSPAEAIDGAKASHLSPAVRSELAVEALKTERVGGSLQDLRIPNVMLSFVKRLLVTMVVFSSLFSRVIFLGSTQIVCLKWSKVA